MRSERDLVRSFGVALCCAVVPIIALIFVPSVGSPFEAPKRAVFVVAAGVIAGVASARGLKLEVESGERTGIRTLAVALLGLGAVEVASAVHSPLGYMARPAMVDLAALVALILGCAMLIAGRERAVMWSIASAGVAEASVALVQSSGVDILGMLGFSTLTVGRMSIYGTLGNPNFVATFCAGTVPALFGLQRMSNGRKTRGILWVLIAIVVGAVLCTGSRGGMVAAAVGVVGSVLMLGRRGVRFRIAAAVLVVIISGIVVPVALRNPRTVKDALAGRTFIWRATLAESRGTLLGSGPNTFAYRYPVLAGKMFGQVSAEEQRFAGIERHAQNDFVEVWTELGVLGLLAFGAAGAAWLRAAKRQARSVEERASVGTRAAIAGVAALMAAAVFDFPLHRPEGLALVGVWMALPMVNPVRMADREPGRRAWTFAMAAGMVIVVLAVWFGVRPFAAEWQASRGRKFEAKGLPAEATKAYQTAILDDKLNGDARFSLVRTLAAEGKYADAMRASRELMGYVNEPECWLLRARIYERLGNENSALRELRVAAIAFPQSRALRQELEILESRHITD